LSEALGTLLANARNGDYASLSALQRLAIRCAAHEKRPSAPEGTATFAAQQAQIALDEAYCDGSATGLNYAQLQQELVALRRHMVWQGDTPAIMAQTALPAMARDAVLSDETIYPTQDELTSLAWDFAKSTQSPEILATALALLLKRPDDSPSGVTALDNVRQALQTDGRYAALDNTRKQLIQESAVEWMACEQGAACGPHGMRQSIFCRYDGNCAAHLDYRSFLRERVLTPTEFELLQTYMAELREAMGRNG